MTAVEATARGKQALSAGRYHEAAHCFAEAIRLAPRVDGLYYHHASALLWRGLPAEALAQLAVCVRLAGPWAERAAELTQVIRRQLALPAHGQMILPGAAGAPRRPRTTLS